MSELRHDPVQKRWVIIQDEGPGLMPAQMAPLEDPLPGLPNPFGPGNEDNTQELWRWPQSSKEPWQVRVLANRFPVLAIEGAVERQAAGHYDVINGVGAHEVIVESRDPNATLASMPEQNAQAVMMAWRNRLRDLAGDPRLRYVLLFKNKGGAAGALHSHPHSQLIATPVTPRTVAMELESARDHYRLKERCLFCDILRQELAEQVRIVLVDEHFVTLCPYASRFPFEMHVLPRRHAHDFRQTDDADLHHLARHLQAVLRRMNRALGNPAYNLMLHTAPNPNASSTRPNYWTTLKADWHWHIEIFPRLRRAGGFEWGTGFYVNPTPPEEAARVLREVEA